MFSNLLKAFAIVGVCASIYVPVQSAIGAPENAGFVAVGGKTLVPYGWVDFCQRYKGECDVASQPALDVQHSQEAMKMVRRINDWVNRNIKPMSDMDHWGVIDQWDYPDDGYGDCEDYVLLKRRMLMQEGLPRSALLVTIVKDEQGEGHAVLTVKTTQGEYILDNLKPEVKPFSKVGYYKFVKRQSQTNQNVWVSIGAPTSAPLTVAK